MKNSGAKRLRLKARSVPMHATKANIEVEETAQTLIDVDTMCAECLALCLSPLYLPWKEYPVTLKRKFSELQNQS
jgi:hypothetical protein